MAHPEHADFLIGIGKRERIRRQLMGEEGGVEINPQIILLRKIDPRVKMAGFELIPVHLFAAGHGIAGVQIDALFAGDEADGLFEIHHELFGGTGLAGIVAGGLNAS